MDVLAIILACSLYPDDDLVRTLADVQSSGNIYFVGDLTTLKTNNSLTSAAAALRFAENVRRHGGRPAVGLIGVPLEWSARYGRAPIELFDACTNVAVATSAFAEYHDRCSSGSSKRGVPLRGVRRRRARPSISSTNLRGCVLSRFARDLGVIGAPAAILQTLAREHASPPAKSPDPPAQRSPILVDDSEASFSGATTRSSLPIFLDARAPAPDAEASDARKEPVTSH